MEHDQISVGMLGAILAIHTDTENNGLTEMVQYRGLQDHCFHGLKSIVYSSPVVYLKDLRQCIENRIDNI